MRWKDANPYARAFEEQYIDRVTWTDILMSLIEPHDSLENLDEVSDVDYSLELELVQTFIDEFTEVMKLRDDDFPLTTRKHSSRIRELYILLVELENLCKNQLNYLKRDSG